ncbi:unnamed protein product [Ceutorhynchus assimilis]|uniref:Transthyretin/hydroxyisourate hydrolase domain-containing protein n=1 Tax=Ceutorhynchus assimilis TaxID=467358 RepID=A0A9N9MGQ5_9CUCU|nr:unnamed protein product [Ceutorhynchus assimilis]
MEIGQIIMTGDIEVDHEENLETVEDAIPFHLINNQQTFNGEEQAGTSSSSNSKGVKYYKQTYRPAWELMPDFKGWLKGVKGEPTRAFCTYCRKSLHAHRLSLLKHTCTIRHQKAAQLHQNYDIIPETVNNMSDDNEIQTVIVNDDGLLVDPLSSAEEEEEDNNSNNDDVIYNEQENSNFTDLKGTFNIFPISTNVTDITKGCSVIGLAVSLYKLIDGRWTYINEGLTDNKGRCAIFFSINNFSSGRYKLHYDVNKYFESCQQQSPFPFVEVVFDCPSVSKYHFTLLLGPNTYTTYRSNITE